MRYFDLVKDKRIFDHADLIAIRLEKTGEYLIKRCRGKDLVNAKVSEKAFKEDLLHNSKTPLVFSDYFVNVSEC